LVLGPFDSLWSDSRLFWLNREILRIANSPEFAWFMEGFTALSVIGSIASIIRWVRLSHSQSRRRAAA
jgi:hypothetical protein